MKVLTYALAFACMPTLAYGVTPAPPQCLGRFHGKLVVRYVTNIHAACPGNLYANACNYRFPNLCVIYLPRAVLHVLCTSTNTPTVIVDAGTNRSSVLASPGAWWVAAGFKSKSNA